MSKIKNIYAIIICQKPYFSIFLYISVPAHWPFHPSDPHVWRRKEGPGLPQPAGVRQSGHPQGAPEPNVPGLHDRRLVSHVEGRHDRCRNGLRLSWVRWNCNNMGNVSKSYWWSWQQQIYFVLIKTVLKSSSIMTYIYIYLHIYINCCEVLSLIWWSLQLNVIYISILNTALFKIYIS